MKTRLSIVGYLATALSIFSQIEVTNTGNVGIGTSSPADKLDVLGDIRAHSAADGQGVKLLGRTSDNFSQLAFYNNAGTAFTGLLQYYGDGTIAFVTSSSLTERMRIGSNGYTGIGTSAPQTTLHVQSPAGAAALRVTDNSRATLDVDFPAVSKLRFNVGAAEDTLFASGGTTLMTIRNVNTGGHVGIGTTSPGRRLSVESPSTTHVEIAGFLAPSMSNANVTYALIGRTAASGECGIWGHEYRSTTSDSFTWLANYGDSHQTGGITVRKGGNVGIGTSAPGYKLEVTGSVRATSFISNSTTYADFVFDPDYRLTPLSEVETHIRAKRHLPGIPSESEAKEHGIDLADMQVKLLQKVEELTLHVIRQDKEIQSLKAKLEAK